MADRAKDFKREFPTASANATLLRQVYARAKIKKKRLKWIKLPKDYDEAKQRQELSTMKALITKAKNAGFRLVYLDETMVTRKTVEHSEWSLPKQNVRVDAALLNEPTLAVLAAISKERGVESYSIFPRSVNIPKFKQYLDDLRMKCGNDKICLFMD